MEPETIPQNDFLAMKNLKVKEFRRHKLRAQQFFLLRQSNINTIWIYKCSSDEWPKIIRAVETLSNIERFWMISCNVPQGALQLKNNSVRDVIVDEIRLKDIELPKQLLRLSLKNCGLTGQTVSKIRDLPVLKDLNLSNHTDLSFQFPNSFPGAALANVLRSSPQIAELNLQNCLIGQEGCKLVGAYSQNLQKLNLSNNNIGDEAIYYLCKGLVKLNVLHISKNNVGNEGFKLCEEFKTLIELYADNNLIGKMDQVASQFFRKIRIFDLSNSLHNEAQNPISNSNKVQIKEWCKSCKRIYI